MGRKREVVCCQLQPAVPSLVGWEPFREICSMQSRPPCLQLGCHLHDTARSQRLWQTFHLGCLVGPRGLKSSSQRSHQPEREVGTFLRLRTESPVLICTSKCDTGPCRVSVLFLTTPQAGRGENPRTGAAVLSGSIDFSGPSHPISSVSIPRGWSLSCVLELWAKSIPGCHPGSAGVCPLVAEGPESCWVICLQ